jgi:hypothetical protein
LKAVEAVIRDMATTASVAGFDETGMPYERIVQAGYAQNPVEQPPPGPKRRECRKQSKARNLLDRFRDHPDSILAFMRDFAVPFDNNQSERDLRIMKLRQKISGTFRSFEAMVNFCRIRGYVSTARKNARMALMRSMPSNMSSWTIPSFLKNPPPSLGAGMISSGSEFTSINVPGIKGSSTNPFPLAATVQRNSTWVVAEILKISLDKKT